MIPQVAASLSASSSSAFGTGDGGDGKKKEKTMRRGPVVIHRLRDLVPRGHEHSVVPRRTAASRPGAAAPAPLIGMGEDAVLSYLKSACSVDGAGNDDDCLLWNVINIAARNRGRLRNDKKAKNAIVDVLLAASSSSSSKPHDEKPLDKARSPPPPSAPVAADLDEVQGLLMRGERESAVSEALSQGNYALALVVASMCDRTTYKIAARRFADEALPMGSPLHTAALLFSNNLAAEGEFWHEEEVYKNLEVTWREQLTSIMR